MTHVPIVLASASPRRHAFLSMLNLPFIVHAADIDETPLSQEAPTALVLRLSQEKAQAVALHYPQALVIAADTIVVFQGQILGKPLNETDAHRMLLQLRGQNHIVYSGLTIWQKSTERYSSYLSETTVTMRNYTDVEIAIYIASGDPLDKAGAYAIQHPTFAPVADFSGCYAGVVGLPLGYMAEGLASFGMTIDNLPNRCTAYTGKSCCLKKRSGGLNP